MGVFGQIKLSHRKTTKRPISPCLPAKRSSRTHGLLRSFAKSYRQKIGGGQLFVKRFCEKSFALPNWPRPRFGPGQGWTAWVELKNPGMLTGNMFYTRNLLLHFHLCLTCRRLGIQATPHLLLIQVAGQRMSWLRRLPGSSGVPPARIQGRYPPSRPATPHSRSAPDPAPEQGRLAGGQGGSRPPYTLRKVFLISTSRFGVGQQANSNRTPLGLHRVAAKIGAGQPIGTVFAGRKAMGLTWQGKANAPIAHRILWLEGLEEGFNRGGEVDSFRRYIYVHGLGDETTLGVPASRGCIHLAAADLIPLFDRLPTGTLVWIE
jgi:L,D-transpeptidase YbiS